jgi:hypothetical protein
MSRKTLAPPAPRFVRHPKRPEWGVGQITNDQYGLVRVCFLDGTVRAFRGDVLEQVPSPEPALTPVALVAPVVALAAAAPKARRVRKP